MVGVLLGRIFKTRYFPRSNFADAKVGFAPSFSWRSIMSAEDIAVNGFRWQIGNGKSVRIQKDNWLPGFSGGKGISQVTFFQADVRVDILIDPNTKQWRKDLVTSNSSEHDAKLAS